MEQFTSSVEAFRRAVELQPRNADIHNHLGLSLRGIGKTEDAISRYRKAIELAPDHALAMYNLANALKENRQPEEAVAWYQRSLSLRANHADGYNNLGTTLKDLSHYDEAIAAFRKAISLKPGMAVFHNNLGLALEATGRSGQAVTACRQAIDCDPNFAEAHRNLADSLRRLGRCGEAIEHYRTALRLRPDYAEAEWNLSIAYLLDGQLDKGFALYHRRHDPSLKITTYPHRYEVPRWDGSSFVQKTILVHCEQGLGDSIQFVRYLPMVKSRGGRVLLEVPKTLLDLFKGVPGVDELLEFSPDRKTTAPFDLFAAIMDLPAIFQTTLETIPNSVPYVFTPKDRIKTFRQRNSSDDFRAGFVWSGNPQNPDNLNRACRPEHFFELTKIGRLKLYSLQKPGMSEAMKVEIEANTGLRDRIVDLSSDLHDMADTAAAIESLDLVITVDTSVAHLAGAMNKPVWILLSASADWRWLLNRDDCPWYPSARLIRQKTLGDWTDVFARIGRSLETIMQSDPTNRDRLLREIFP
jgi:Flp pilus assembly protein TadD